MDAIEGLTHHTKEVIEHVSTLPPFSQWLPPQDPRGLYLRAVNANPNDTYTVVVIRHIKTVSFDKENGK